MFIHIGYKVFRADTITRIEEPTSVDLNAGERKLVELTNEELRHAHLQGLKTDEREMPIPEIHIGGKLIVRADGETVEIFFETKQEAFEAYLSVMKQLERFWESK